MPDARRRSRVRSGRRGRRRRRGRGRREEGGTAHAGRLRAPHLLVGARPLAGSLWSATRSSCPLGVGAGEGVRGPQIPLPQPPGARVRPPPPVTSAETGRDRKKSEGRTNKRLPPATSREIGWGARPTFTISRAGRGLRPEGAGAGLAQRNSAAAEARGAGWSRGGAHARRGRPPLHEEEGCFRLLVPLGHGLRGARLGPAGPASDLQGCEGRQRWAGVTWPHGSAMA